MGHKAVAPADTRIDRQDLVPADRFLEGRLTGLLEVRWKIDPGHPVVIGAGWFQAQRPVAVAKRPARRGAPVRPESELVAEIVRRGPEGLPVLPGSSLKGAVRQAYELLTPSCRLLPGRQCKVGAKQRSGSVCPACSFFGAMGLGGRLAFGEARPEGQRGHDWDVQKVSTPTAWPPRRAPRDTVRVYDRRKAVSGVGDLQPEVERAWSVQGDFRSRLRLVNASEEELGLLFAALGLGAEDSPMLRLGGRKFHGLGAVDVELVEVRWRHGGAQKVSEEPPQAYARRLAERALSPADRRRAWDDMQRTISKR